MLPAINSTISNFTVLRTLAKVPGIEFAGIELKHIDSEMKILKLIPLDLGYNEATFSISFSTPSTDSTGIQHITEHSVLCGSEKFPSKEPFTNLLQSSLQTFLNAMTYSDHTCYPLSSRNEQDFFNMMNVYLDAVFFPNIQQDDRIFQQEGHHFHIEGDIHEHRGVVLNEMRGVYSNPTSQGYTAVQEALFQESPLRFDSGGEPSIILNLTADDLKHFHKKHYKPSNSFTMLVSQYDLQKELDFINTFLERMNGSYGHPIKLSKQQEYQQPQALKKIDFGISESQQVIDTAVHLAGYRLYDCDTVSSVEFLALNLIDYLLHDSPASPFKKEISQQGIGQKFQSSLDYTQNQAYISLVVTGGNPTKSEDYQKLLQNIYKEIVSGDFLTANSLEAGLNNLEFKVKEIGDHYGVKLMQQLYLGWPYGADFEKFFDHEKPILELREMLLNTSIVPYIKTLITKYFINNKNYCQILMNPVVGLNDKKQVELKKQEQEYYSSLTEGQLQVAITLTKELIKKQSSPDSQEAIDALPKLQLQDLHGLSKELLVLKGTRQDENISLYTYDTKSKGIDYFNIIIDVTNQVDEAYLMDISILSKIYKKTCTKLYKNKQELQQISDKLIGSLDFEIISTEVNSNPRFMLQVSSKFLSINSQDAIHLIYEIIFGTTQGLSNHQELLENINEFKASLQEKLTTSLGHITAANRAMSQFSQIHASKEYTQGIRLLNYLNQQGDIKANIHISNQLISIIQNLKTLPALFSIGSTDPHVIIKEIEKQNLLHKIEFKSYYNEKFELRNKIPICTSSIAAQINVNYVAAAAQKSFQIPSSASLLAESMLYSGYLWENVRVMGGAYGCFLRQKFNGIQYIVSYRDPQLQKTIENYRNIGKFLREISIDDNSLLRFKIGAIGSRQKSIAPADRYSLSLQLFLDGVDIDQYAQTVENIVNVNFDDLKKVGEDFEDISQGKIVVVGKASQVKEWTQEYDVI
ncbi:Insulinase [Spironucleus salmonicida]|uniref:Insulinase n=1 Tax=Spironucleus salmonicida TaxID=348837 RepID=V6LL96_9EUKA|nr:Insulinase [Spironucleus salmonicida]|eukprot:EST45327.1 Metalloprotease, insulinase family protein [Spironucleus salmonicida]